MSRAVVWGSGLTAILIVATFVPADFLTQGKSRQVGGQELAAAPETSTPTTHSKRQSISAALSETDARSATQDSQSAATLLPKRHASPSPAPDRTAAQVDLPASLPRDAAPPSFASTRLLASMPPPATAPTIRAIQGELRRHGCYEGALDGDWGPASRYAASAFTAAVNATLPVDQPDAALLTLARRYPGRVCAAGATDSVATTATAIATEIGATTAATGRIGPSSNAISPPVTHAPRIVRSGGPLAITAVVPSSPNGAVLANRMALGADMPTDSQAPVTRPAPGDRAPAARTRARNKARAIRLKARNNRRGRKRTRWRQNVFKPIHLGGS
jgi:hypothetical protein